MQLWRSIQTGRLPIQEQKCFYCGKTGHISQMCRSKTRGRDNRTQLVKQDDARQPAEDSTELSSIYEVTTRKNASEPPIKSVVEVGGEKLETEGDTGATSP